MNSVVLAIGLMIFLCVARVPVTIALIASALAGGLHSGLSTQEAIAAINDNLLVGSQVGMTYIMVGALAVALARSGVLDLLARKLVSMLGNEDTHHQNKVKWLLYGVFMVASILSQNAVPVHIAFIPVMIPPLLVIFNKLRIDRRAIACILACSISSSYLLLPTGFGAIFLNEILLANVNDVGSAYDLAVTADMVPKAMFLPVMGILAGMLVAIFFSYRKPRDYTTNEAAQQHLDNTKDTVLKPFQLVMTLIAIAVTLVFQITFDSLLVGAMIGFMILSISGIFRWDQQDDVFTEGMRMMVQIAVIITIASGFAGVLEATGEIKPLVQASAEMIGDHKALAAAIMLIVGLFITIGFGDSFASVPILAPIYIPLALTLGFSPMAAVALLGASAALGDAGSPASTITLGATSGLNADGQHDHVRDSVIPTFMHANFGMVIFAWVAAMIL
ncbi:TRAP transporter large permease subunit [Marinomonas rhizomae]|uniref:Na+/H+ antiporter family protein n=1 Tax=Marinomonas rhizomae TaxID=491948 RepID=UPI000DEBBCCB|nr:Na+/H+ antiporter NhaC family protein [Marinomonas rhizomae]RNF72034.1 TRAP transporter large permease subunit [Marinomonas rhizomae]